MPGHHLQMALQKENTSIPLIRRALWFNAYSEGWALYAEKLAFEEGFYKEPAHRLGYLNSELFRAARLVVDTGIHYKQWTRDEAIDYFVSLGINKGMASSEVSRYMVMPGQATSYKIGELKILELREKMKEALGEKYDIKEFHRIILENGSIPLELLEKQVDQYIAEHK